MQIFKRTITALSLLLIVNAKVSAQSGTPECKIRYSYDAAGNRILREYKCITPPGPGDPAPWIDPGGLISNIYPVPTTGVTHVVFSAAIPGAHLYITNMSGVLVQDYPVTQQQVTNITIDLTPLIPGTYLLTCVYNNTTESYTIPKFQQ